MRRTLIERFAEKIQLNEETGCWEWTAWLLQGGYGAISLGGKCDGWRLAHRVAYELFSGPIPEGMCCLHRCDNPKCVNPAHLFLGTHFDNMRDCTIKGRRASGERHYRAKLCESQISEMRRLVAGGMTKMEVADMFGTTHQNVGYICRGNTWKANLSKESSCAESNIVPNVCATVNQNQKGHNAKRE